MGFFKTPAQASAPDPWEVITAFFASLKNAPPDKNGAGQFLLALHSALTASPSLPPPSENGASPKAGILADLGGFLAGSAGKAAGQPGTGTSGSIIRERIESRYQRIRFVQEELGKLDFKKIKTPAAFNDINQIDQFIFDHIDFSIYQKISAEQFRLIYDTGLDDFGDSFFQRAFKMDREELRKVIHRNYLKIGGAYYGKNENPLLLPIMRNLHTSLEFVPLINQEELLNECNGLLRYLLARIPANNRGETLSKETYYYLARNFRALFQILVSALDKVSIRHNDGMETTLFIPEQTDRTANPAALLGTFHPLNKAYTITLIP
ncbi:hypothetical protein FACS189468_7420 [Spirochaetia bacterium]|nr:hypothetical protein FACS189468_7420 [Spirochaetia bacterium]